MLLKTKKFYREKASQLELFSRGLSGFDENPIIGCGKKLGLSELKNWLEEKISATGELKIVDEKDAKITCVLFAEYPDSEGYDIFGCSCFIGRADKSKITYCGLCGDVNTFRFTDANSVKVFVR